MTEKEKLEYYNLNKAVLTDEDVMNFLGYTSLNTLKKMIKNTPGFNKTFVQFNYTRRYDASKVIEWWENSLGHNYDIGR